MFSGRFWFLSAVLSSLAFSFYGTMEEVDSSKESHDGTNSEEENKDSSNSVEEISNESVNKRISNNSTKGKNKENWKTTKSQKRKLEETDSMLDKSISRLNVSIKQQENYLKQMDEDSLYCVSLTNMLRKLDDKNKAVVQNSTEKIFLNMQSGMQNTMQFTTQQPIQLGSQNMLRTTYMWQPTSNTFTAHNDQQVG